jgi:hypothetical protein
MNNDDNRNEFSEKTLQELLILASVEKDTTKLLALMKEINFRFKLGESPER